MEAPTLNDCQQLIIGYMERNRLHVTKSRKILIRLIGEFKTGFTSIQLSEKASEHGICEATVFNFIKMCSKAKAIEPPIPAYYSFKVVDAEIVTGKEPE